MGSFDGKEEVVRLKKKRLLVKIGSVVFFVSSLIFLIVYLSLPQSKARDFNLSANLKGTTLLSNPELSSSSTLITREEILGGMGIEDGTYSAFVDIEKAKENLKNAPFVSDKIEPVISKSAFSLDVEFADLFPIVSIGGENYLSDGTRYPYDNAGLTEAVTVQEKKQDWVLNHYPRSDLMVPFLEDPQLGNDHSASIPPLFYVWDFLTQKDLKAVRYENASSDYLFYWVKEDGLALRIRIDKDLLPVFGRPNYRGNRNYQEPIYAFTNGSDLTNNATALAVDASLKGLDQNSPDTFVPIEFMKESSSDEYLLAYDKGV